MGKQKLTLNYCIERKKWSLTVLVAIATLAVAFVSSAYTGGVNQMITDLHTTDEVVVLGISLFVLGVSYCEAKIVWESF